MLALPTLLTLATLASSGPDPDPELHRVALPTGVTIQYAVQGPTTGRPVVLLHGLSDSWQSFELLLPQLSPDLRAFAVDLRGHGGSDRPPGGYDMDTMAADVVALIRALDLRDVIVVGHSMGSFVAREVVRQGGDRVAGLVVIGTALKGDNAVVRGLADEIAAMGEVIPTEFIVAFQQSTVAMPLPQGFMDRVVAASRLLPPHVWRGAAAGILAHGQRATSEVITVPTLVIGGALDGVFTEAEHRALLGRVRQGELVMYPEIGHAPHWEAPGRVAGDLGAFIHRHRLEPAGAQER